MCFWAYNALQLEPLALNVPGTTSMLHVFVGSSAMLRKRARLRSLALVLLLAAVTLIELGTADPSFSRQVCGLSSTALLLYASGLSPGSPASARCERCIISFASSRVDQASGADTFFAYKKDSVLSCHAVYLASVMAMRETCIDCKTEIDGLRQAIEEPKNSCNVPMQKAIDLGHERCQSISLESFPLGPKVAGIECELRLVDALTVFHDGGTANETSCVKSLRSVKEEAQVRLRKLSSSLVSRYQQGYYDTTSQLSVSSDMYIPYRCCIVLFYIADACPLLPFRFIGFGRISQISEFSETER